VWVGASPDDVDDRETDGERERLEHAVDDYPGRRHRGDRELHAVGVPECPPSIRIDGADRRRDDHGAEDR
jgi:hypothetical protein